MKKKILFIVSAIVCLCISFGVGASFADESPWAYDSGTGRTVLTDGTEKFYINSESARYVLDGTLRGDYSVSASFQGNVSITDTTTDRFDIGLLVWYYDQNNWVSLSLAWWNGFSDAKVTDVLVVTCDGGALSYADHYFDNPTYNANAVFTKYATDKVTISATKTYDAVNGYDVYTFYGEGEEMFTQNIGVSAKYRSAAARVGYVGNCAAAAFTFEAPTISVPGPDGTPVEYSEIAGAPAGVKGVGNWSFTDDKYTISSDNSAYVNHIVVGNEYSDTNYKVDIEVSFLAATNESAVLLSGWYVGQSDMVAFVLKNTDAGWVVATEGKINGADIAAASKAISFDGNVTLQIAKIGQRISLNYNDETLLQYSAGELENGTDCVFGVGNADASLKISFDSVPYNAYDFYQYSQNGITYRVSAPDMDSVSIDDTGIVMEATADNLTRLVYNAPSSGTVTLTAGFGGTATYFGAYMYYVDEDNNIAVAIEENKITLITKMGGEETSESFGYSGTADTLTLSVKGRTISAFVNDSAVFENVEVAGINIVDVFAIGFFAKNGTLNITGIEASGFRPFSDVLDGKFVLRGDSFSTWQVDGEKLIGDCTNGTTWNATLAFTANEFLPSDG
ncbi:MAG: hypothetical protein ACI4S9_03245, partial [Christensenellales bacterium]